MSRVVVIGGGIGGLAVAARLARMRHDVTLVERSDAVGGKLGEWSRDGFRFDTGPSLVTLARDVARPVPQDRPARSRRCSTCSRWSCWRTTGFPTAPARCAQQRRARHRVGVPGRVRRQRRTATGRGSTTRRAHVGGRARHPSSSRRSAVRDAGVARPAQTGATCGGSRPGARLRDVGRASFDDPRQVLFLDRYATYTGSDPRRAPAVLVGRPVRRAHLPRLVRRRRTAADRGAVARARRATEGADHHRRGGRRASPAAHGRVDGVELADGSRLDADIVVSDVDARRALRASCCRAPSCCDRCAARHRACPASC